VYEKRLLVLNSPPPLRRLPLVCTRSLFDGIRGGPAAFLSGGGLTLGMGNQAPTRAAENRVNVVEESYLYAIDPETGERVPIETDGGLLKAVVESSAGNRLTDSLESEGDDEQRIRLYAEDDAGNLADIQAEELGTALDGTETALVTKLSEILESVADDQARVSLYGEDDTGTLEAVQIGALDSALNGTESAIATVLSRALDEVGNTEVRMRTLGEDDTGTLQEAQVEALDTGVAGGTFGQLTYLARALVSQGQDELVSRITDSDGTQVDPALATRYLDSQTVGHDLIASGDITIVGPVERGTAVTIAVTSTDNNPFSVSVEWEDDSANVFQTESAADIGLDTITEDYARLVRKSPWVSITVTDESGAAENKINLHADTER